MALLLPLLLMMAAPESATPPAGAANRVYFAPIAAGPGADVGTISVFEQRLLSSARRHQDVQVVGAQDVQSLLDHEATRQQSGCDEGSIACAAELAGALDAPRMVTGQLGRVGSTWVLSLTLIERGTLNVIGRSSRQRKGETPEDLLNDVDGMIDELVGAAAAVVAAGAPRNEPWPAIGVASVVLGGAGLVVGGGATGASWLNYNSVTSNASSTATDRANAKALGEVLNTTAIVGLVVGAAACIVGGGVLLLTGEEGP